MQCSEGSTETCSLSQYWNRPQRHPVKQWPFIHTLYGTQNKRDRVREAAGRRIVKLYMSENLPMSFCLHLKRGAKYVSVSLAAGGEARAQSSEYSGAFSQKKFNHTQFEQERFSLISRNLVPHSFTAAYFFFIILDSVSSVSVSSVSEAEDSLQFCFTICFE